MKQGISKYFLFGMISLIALLLVNNVAQAEVLRERYTFEFNRATRRASEQRAQILARKQFLRDFLGKKFSKEIVDNLAEDIDIALDPPDSYLLSFDLVGTPKINENETQITITVEGNVDLPGDRKSVV